MANGLQYCRVQGIDSAVFKLLNLWVCSSCIVYSQHQVDMSVVSRL